MIFKKTYIFYHILFLHCVLLSYMMEMLKPFLKVNPPTGDQLSPRKAETPTLTLGALKNLQEIKVGDYLIKAEKINEDSVDGYSIIFFNNIAIFEGEMIRSRKNGFGVQYNPKGNVIYEGYFRDDRYDGWGRTSCYTGQFRDGLYDGYGIYSVEHYYFQGLFQKAQPSGEGISFKGENMVKFHPVKNIYDFLNLGLKNNMSILQEYKIDEIYLGEWKQGVKHGFGRLWKANYWYSGQFSNDLPHGLGAEQTKTSKEEKVVQTIYKLGVKK